MPSRPQPYNASIATSSFRLLAGRWLPGHAELNLALIDQALVSGVNFLTGILLARFLGIEEFGRFTLVWMLVLLVNMIQLSLVLQPMMSLGPKQAEEDMAEYFGAVSVHQLILCLGFALLTLLAGVGCQMFFPQWQVAPLTMPMLAVIIAFQAQEFIRRYFFTRRRMLAAFLNDLISYGGQVLLLIGCFLAFKGKTDTVLWIIALTSAIATFAGFLQMEQLKWRKAATRQIAEKHWHFSKWLGAGSFMQWIGGQFFVMVSAAFFSAVAAGAIAAARNILGLTLVLFAAMENFISVRASVAFREGGWPALKSYILKVSLYGGLANGLICLLAAALAPFWMKTLFGPAYVDYSYLVYWFAATHLVMFFIRPLTSLLRTVEYTRPVAFASFLPMAFSLAASIPLIKTLGLTGAMLVMLMTQALMLLFLLSATLYWRKGQV